jgi:nucleotide-binding universal stress UspA family protein
MARRPEEDNPVSILERLLYQHGRAAKMSDRHAAGLTTAEGNGHGMPDMLPLGGSSAEVCKNCSVLVVVNGDELDQELMALACAVAEKKHAQDVHVIYGIEVPRTKPVDEEMPRERAKADQALDKAEEDARQCHIAVDKEYIQSRNVGQCLVDAAAIHDCALLIVGVPYNAPSEGQFELTDTVDYVLKNAPCRVWVVRGQPPVGAIEPRRRADQRQPAGAR